MSTDTVESSAYIEVRDSEGCFALGNERVEFTLDRKTGYMNGIYNKELAWQFKHGARGSYPCEIEISGKTIEITPTGLNTISSHRIVQEEGGRLRLEIAYDNLKALDGTETGLSIVANYLVAPDDEYIKFNVHLDNRKGIGTIQSLNLACGGEYQADPVKNHESFAYVDWFGGFLRKNPHELDSGLVGKKNYPAYWVDNVTCGWFDLFSSEGRGVGIAYINRQQLAMAFNFNNVGKGFTVYPRLFHRANGPDSGETFTTDFMIVAAHTGDWHAMADIYRTEYEKAFVDDNGDPDYLTWKSIPEKAKIIDYVHHTNIMDNGKLNNPFDKIPAVMQDQANYYYDQEDASLEHALLWFYGQNEHNGYAGDVPKQVPCNAAAGGTSGCIAMIEELHQKGAKVMAYNHPYAYDPNSSVYNEEIDTGQHFEHWNGVTHHACCIDNDYTNDLWNNTIIPDFRMLGADSMQFDQGSLLQTMCNRPGHFHSLTGISRLQSHIRAVDRLTKLVASNLCEDGSGFVITEGANDMTTRHCCFWQVRDDINPNSHPEMRTYTFPQYRAIFARAHPIRTVCLGGIEPLNDQKPWNLEGKDEWKREYIRLKNALRAAEAPGYPFGFRDNIGLRVGSPDLFARVFTEGSRFTVVCYGENDVDSFFEINRKKLGVEDGDVTRIDVSLKKGKGAFFVL